jgi:import receptor subunit TOM70
MSAPPAAMAPGKSLPDFASSTPQSSLWDRISTWASENKAVVYTIAGVAVVVTGAGVAYYLTDSVGGMSIPNIPHNWRG